MSMLGNIVKLTVEHPYGVDDITVKGDIGVIRGIEEQKDGTLYYTITARHGDFGYAYNFIYTEEEFTLASDEECREELKKVLSFYN